MKPVAIFRHSPTEGPGYFGAHLEARGIPYRIIAIDADDAIPVTLEAYSGLVFMGGPMSVNDDLPWIQPVLSLIRQAGRDDVPMLGHCLGGQLIAKALGGVVSKNPTKEIGWGRITIEGNDVARHWFGDITGFESFHWHGETFSLPPGATKIMASRYCDNQGYAIGKHLGMQCHVEMTERLIDTWLDVGQDEIGQSAGPAVQQPAQMRSEMARKVADLHVVAGRLYDRWLEGLKR